MYRIRKKFKFEGAHILTKAFSKECMAIHGHSYVMEVFIAALGLNADGMVIDFKLLKKMVKSIILDRLDHALIVQNVNEECEDYGDYKHFLSTALCHRNLIMVDYNPTAENMVKDFYESLFGHLAQEIKSLVSLKIRLHETETGWAEYGGMNIK